MKAAVDPAAKASVKMEEAAPAVMGGDGQWPAVLGLGWWPVAAMAEMAGEKAASTMSEAVAAMVVVAAGTNRNVLGGFTTFVMLQEQNRSLHSSNRCAARLCADHFFAAVNRARLCADHFLDV